jgi:hypothetical protein
VAGCVPELIATSSLLDHRCTTESELCCHKRRSSVQLCVVSSVSRSVSRGLSLSVYNLHYQLFGSFFIRCSSSVIQAFVLGYPILNTGPQSALAAQSILADPVHVGLFKSNLTSHGVLPLPLTVQQGQCAQFVHGKPRGSPALMHYTQLTLSRGDSGWTSGEVPGNMRNVECHFKPGRIPVCIMHHAITS